MCAHACNPLTFRSQYLEYLQNFRRLINESKTVTPYNDKTLNNTQSAISSKVIQTAELINRWHKTLTLPERWYPLQLGRVAAQFGVSRELAASALVYGGWIEYRSGSTSFWKRYLNK
jgi:predicted ATPase